VNVEVGRATALILQGGGDGGVADEQLPLKTSMCARFQEGRW
jgi:hypothetical protein